MSDDLWSINQEGIDIVHEIQDLLFDIAECKCLEAVKERVLQMNLFSSPRNRGILFRNVYFAATFRIKAIPNIIQLLKLLVPHLPPQFPLKSMKENILSTFFPNSDVNNAYIYFVHQCMVHGLLTPEEIVKKVREFKANHFDCSFSWMSLFCWFAPEIESFDPQLFEEMHLMFIENAQSSKLPTIFQFFVQNFHILQDNNWSILKMYLDFEKSDNLMIAIFRDDITLLKNHIERSDYDVNSRIDPHIYSPSRHLQRYPPLLSVAAFYGSKQCFHYLLDYGADPQILDFADQSLIQFAIAGGDPEIIEIAKQLQPNCPYAHIAARYHRDELITDDDILNLHADGTILHHAAYSNALTTVLRCLKLGVDPNCVNEDGASPLHMAAETGSVDSIKVLVNYSKANINLRDVTRKTPIFYTAENGHDEALLVLMSLPNIDVNNKDENLLTPLMVSALFGHGDLVQAMLENPKVDAQAVDSTGMTVVHWAAQKNRFDALKALLHFNLDVNACRDDGKTALHLAAQYNNPNVVKLLLDYSTCEPNPISDEGETPLHCAVEAGAHDALEQLLKNPLVNVNAQSNDGSTPLHIAARKADEFALKSLIQCKNIDSKIKNKDLMTPAEVAQMEGNNEIVEFLMTYNIIP